MSDFAWNKTRMIPHYTGGLSMCGSAFILVDILLQRKTKLRTSVNRIVLAISIFDLLSSFWYFMGVWAQPNIQGSWISNPDQKGTVGTCETSGFFIQLANTAVPLYNTMLAAQYFFVIKYNWRDRRIFKIERYVHCIVPVLALAFAIAPLPLNLYNAWYGWCWITPSGWENGYYTRGTDSQADVFYATYFILTLSSGFVVAALMIAIYCAVRKTMKKIQRYDFQRQCTLSGAFESAMQKEGSSRSLGTAETNFSSSNRDMNERSTISTKGRRKSNRLAKRCQQVRRMALLYTIPYIVSWVIPACIFLKQYMSWRDMARFNPNQKLHYASVIYVATAQPLQGFMNWLVYCFPWISKNVKKALTRLRNALVPNSSSKNESDKSSTPKNEATKKHSGLETAWPIDLGDEESCPHHRKDPEPEIEVVHDVDLDESGADDEEDEDEADNVSTISDPTNDQNPGLIVGC